MSKDVVTHQMTRQEEVDYFRKIERQDLIKEIKDKLPEEKYMHPDLPKGMELEYEIHNEVIKEVKKILEDYETSST